MQNHVFSVLHRGANCIGRQWCVYCIRATCRGLRSLPPPSGEALPLPTPYCWIHIAHFPFTSILNNGLFLFKVPERQLPRFAIVYSGLPRWCSRVVIFLKFSSVFSSWLIWCSILCLIFLWNRVILWEANCLGYFEICYFASPKFLHLDVIGGQIKLLRKPASSYIQPCACLQTAKLPILAEKIAILAQLPWVSGQNYICSGQPNHTLF